MTWSCLYSKVSHTTGRAMSCSARRCLLERDVNLGGERLAQDTRGAAREG